MQGQGFETSSLRLRHIQYLSKAFEIISRVISNVLTDEKRILR